jgi:hypothetical protein
MAEVAQLVLIAKEKTIKRKTTRSMTGTQKNADLNYFR